MVTTCEKRKEKALNRDESCGGSDYSDAQDLEVRTGTKASTWRYWSYIGKGPASFKLGRRRVWRNVEVDAWLAEQEGVR